jgi:hypothetical protein
VGDVLAAQRGISKHVTLEILINAADKLTVRPEPKYSTTAADALLI